MLAFVSKRSALLVYLAKRLALFVVVIWVAATINFVLPQIAGGNPIMTVLLEQAKTGGHTQSNLEAMVAEYEREFGLDQPLWRQYVVFVEKTVTLDFGFSLANYPTRVSTLIANSLPWTIALLGVSTAIGFSLGTLLGGLMAWPRTPRLLSKVLLPPLLTLSAVPYYLLGLALMWIFAFQTGWFPISGAFTPGIIPDWSNPSFLLDVARHMVLPVMSIVLSSMGFWALGMRAMVVSTLDEDYLHFAEAKGLRQRTLFLRYGSRNALLPQVTALGLTIGQIVSGALLVEVVFGYPGVGSVLYRSVRFSDYFAIQGVVFAIIVSVTVATLILDLIYPKIDPRITHVR